MTTEYISAIVESYGILVGLALLVKFAPRLTRWFFKDSPRSKEEIYSSMTFEKTDIRRQSSRERSQVTTLSLIRRVYGSCVRPRLIGIDPNTDMAWRPYENFINGELDNTTPGKVTGWMRFFRIGKQPLRVTLQSEG